MYSQEVDAKITHKATVISLAKGQFCKILAVPVKIFIPVPAPVSFPDLELFQKPRALPMFGLVPEAARPVICGPLELDPAIVGSPLALLTTVKESYSELITVDSSLDFMKVPGSPVCREVRSIVMPVSLAIW